MSEATTQPTPTQRLPWPLIAAVLTALLAFHLSVLENAEYFRSIGLIAALILLSQFVPMRLPKGFILPWVIRAVMYTIIISTIGIPKEPFRGWYVEPHYTNLLGMLIAAEFALRCWMPHKTDPRSQAEVRGVALLVTALIMTAAADTFQIRLMHVHLLAPVYCVFVVLSLRSFTEVSEIKTARPRQSRAFVALRAITVIVALTIAGGTSYAVARYQSSVTAWAMQKFQDRFINGMKPRTIGMGPPKLEKVDNPIPSLERVAVVEGSNTQRHLRMLGYDSYVYNPSQKQTTSWLPASIPDRAFHPLSPAQLKPPGSLNTPGPKLHITLISDTFDVLMVPLQAASVSGTRGIRQDLLGTLQYGLVGDNSSYDVQTPFPAGDFQGPLCVAPDALERKLLLKIPDTTDPRVVALAQRVAGTGDTRSRIANITRELWSHHQYSLQYTPQDGGDPLNEFILKNGNAHCQYFASAAVVMCRAIGVPTRFVTGYYLHEPYGDNAMVVRDRDAHAWAECWIDGTGWVTVDATPATGRPDAQYKDVPLWRQRWERVQDIPRNIRRWIANASWTKLIAIAAAVAAIWIGWTFWGRWRKRTKRLPPVIYTRISPELQSAARRFERVLRRGGVVCQPQRPWRENIAASDAKAAKALDRPLCLRFVEAYDAARFGGANGQSLQTLGGILETLEKT